MATVLAPLQSPVGGDLDRLNQMIDYAFSRYQYVITPRECEEILTQSYWESVDAFCSYMIAANFGQSVPGTRNVKLPTTIRLYTDAELDAMENGHTIRPIREEPTHNEESEATYFEDTPHVDITQDFEETEEVELDDEYLPPYTPDIRPPYSLIDPMKSLSEISLEIQADIPEDDPPAYSATVDTPEESAITDVNPERATHDTCDVDSVVEDALRNDSIREAETEVSSTSRLALLCSLGSRVELKLRKLAHASPLKRTAMRVREFKQRLRQKQANTS